MQGRQHEKINIDAVNKEGYSITFLTSLRITYT